MGNLSAHSQVEGTRMRLYCHPLSDDGFLLWESHAIMQYLADGSPGQDFYPRDVRTRADVNRWLFWSAYHFTPAVGFISRERVSKKWLAGPAPPIGQRSSAVRRCSRQQHRRLMITLPEINGLHRTSLRWPIRRLPRR